ncbi:MAG: putative disulfide isomerase [Idiomarina sp. T82-3]|uniref:DsbE family thiol:disulfide interchange protein n=1 Tax=Idiomarina TaxID=135575 RepID=UPI000799A1DD|nr:DsbE family thiol:disulfide interchange protein [Idiomarina sp. T82-3]KXS35272.1 MAG: putative disulfide isomerase [Idiomarina sp. T82-3]
MNTQETHSASKKWIVLFVPLILFIVLVVFLLKGLGKDPTHLESVLINKPVPEFSAEDLFDPTTQHSEQVLKKGPLLFNVWATWCPTCRAEHEFLNELAAQGIPIVGLNYKDDSRGKAMDWLNTLGDPYIVNLYDPEGKVAFEFGVYGAPETYFIDADGRVRYRHVGDVNPRNWENQLKAIYQQMVQEAKQ